MTCAPLLVAIRDGLEKLDEQMKIEEQERKAEERRVAENEGEQSSGGGAGAMAQREQQGNSSQRRRTMTPLEREATRRLLRQATAIQKAQVKGNCLMVMPLKC